MINHAVMEEISSAKYVHNFMDMLENMPDEVQRQISTMRELDVSYQALLNDMDLLRQELESRDMQDSAWVKRLLVQLQDKLIESQELADGKLSSVQIILDIIEKRQHSLEQNSKSLESETENERSEASVSRGIGADAAERPSKRPRRTPRMETSINYGGSSSGSTLTSSITATAHSTTSNTTTSSSTNNNNNNGGGGSSNTAPTVVTSNTSSGHTGPVASSSSSSTNSSNNNSTTNNAASNSNNTVSSTSSGTGGVSTAAAASSSSSNSGSGGGAQQLQHQEPAPFSSLPDKSASAQKNAANKAANQKKTSKKKKRKARADRDRDDSPPELPIDPDEPTYCLCEQVSYGEMIGCDNDLCPIEWFHFSCVNLTHKPKGKWFCPKCRGDKPTIMKPRAQFLRELEKYNKEKEEKS